MKKEELKKEVKKPFRVVIDDDVYTIKSGFDKDGKTILFEPANCKTVIDYDGNKEFLIVNVGKDGKEYYNLIKQDEKKAYFVKNDKYVVGDVNFEKTKEVPLKGQLFRNLFENIVIFNNKKEEKESN